MTLGMWAAAEEGWRGSLLAGLEGLTWGPGGWGSASVFKGEGGAAAGDLGVGKLSSRGFQSSGGFQSYSPGRTKIITQAIAA